MNSTKKPFLQAVIVLLVLARGAAQAAVLTENYPGAPFTEPKFNSTVLGTYAPSTNFVVGGTTYTLNVNPIHPAFQNDPTASFLNIVSNQASSVGNNLKFGDLYTFNTVNKDLNNNDLSILSYSAHTGFGVDFFITNKTTTITGNNVHWIQTLVDNWNINGNPGDLDSKVDKKAGTLTDPYYDNGFDATDKFLSDDPSRPQSQLNNIPIYFNFETFLVYQNSSYTLNADNTVKTKGSIDIYDGVLWGFTVPEPGALTLALVGGVCCLCMRRRRSRTKSRGARVD